MELAIPALNSMLKSPEFWGPLAAAGVTHTLFFQTDSLLVHSGIEDFMQVGGWVGGCWVGGWVGRWLLGGWVAGMAA